jgi:hypothetical protein
MLSDAEPSHRTKTLKSEKSAGSDCPKQPNDSEALASEKATRERRIHGDDQ